jgi:3-phosphoshikimate 1-carboxyvinyltransferase
LLVSGTVVLDGDPPLRRRPILPLLHALEGLGATIETDGGHPPIRITSSGLPGGHVRVDAAASSQFATSLLLVSPYGEKDLELEVVNLGAAGYVELTLEAMCRWGAEASATGKGRYRVTAGRHYQAGGEVVEYDASAAGHLFALAMASGGSVTVPNVVATRQPDAGLMAVFEAMGATITAGPGGGVRLEGPASLRGVDVDISLMPDQVPTLAVLGALAGGTTRLRNVAVARGHETDRVVAITRELRKLGADLDDVGDALIVHGGRPLTGAVVDTYDDHRMAMALSSLGASVGGVVIRHPGCVAKTYPGYWRDAAALGLRLRRPS